jgi:putative methyltransferase (TIGR04325 family)
LQYLEDPMLVLHSIASIGCHVVVIDRTPFSSDDVRHVVTQHVPARLGRASYPAWLLSRTEVHARLREHYDTLLEYETLDQPARIPGTTAPFYGSVWHRRA